MSGSTRERDGRRRSFASALGQSVQNLALAEGSSLASRGLRVAAHRLRRLLLALGDPLVSYEMHGHSLLLPLSHQLPHYRRSYPRYDEALGHLAALLAPAYPDGVLVDIGANVGDTAAMLRAACTLPILCVEANGAFVKLLRLNTSGWKGIVVESVFLGETEATLSGRLVAVRGTGRLVSTEPGSVQSTTLPALVAKHSDLGAPCLIKIDTDGFDLRILLGARSLLVSRRPVLFFEYDPSFGELADRPPSWVFDYLESCGYSNVLLWNNFGEYLGQRSIREASATAPFVDLAQAPGSFLDLATFSPADEAVATALDRHERDWVPAAPRTRP